MGKISENHKNCQLVFPLLIKLLIEKIGLSWEDEILKFHENNRAVETNSLLQVRSKVYKDSSQNWKKYEKHLTPVMEILKNNNIKF